MSNAWFVKMRPSGTAVTNESHFCLSTLSAEVISQYLWSGPRTGARVLDTCIVPWIDLDRSNVGST